MVRNDTEIQKIVQSFRKLSLEVGGNPAPFLVVDGWRLIAQLEKTKFGKIDSSLQAVINALTHNVSLYPFDIERAWTLLHITTESEEDSVFVKGCSPTEREAVIQFARAIYRTVTLLSVPQY